MANVLEWAHATVHGAVVSVFLIAWTFGGVIGAIYWAINDNLLFVVLSLFIPLFGAVTIISDLAFG